MSDTKKNWPKPPSPLHSAAASNRSAEESDDGDVSESNPMVSSSVHKIEKQDRVRDDKQARADGVFSAAELENDPEDFDFTVSGHRPRGDDALRPGQVFQTESSETERETPGQASRRKASGG